MKRFLAKAVWQRVVVCASSIWMGAAPVGAWWDSGHKIVAQIAYDDLDATERRWVMDLLEKNPTRRELFEAKIREELGDTVDEETRQRWFFSQASVWADLVREREGYENASAIHRTYNQGARHYTDFPIFIDEAARVSLVEFDKEPLLAWEPGQREPEFKLNSMQTFAKIYREAGDPTIPVEERSVNLLWLFHLVGDTHQPCHCAQLFVPRVLPEGDRGANSIWILGIKNRSFGMDSDTLHAFWDSLANGETNTHQDVMARTKALSDRAELMEKGREAAKVMEPLAWLKEGRNLAHEAVYPPFVRERVASANRQNVLNRHNRMEEVVLISLPVRAMDDYTTTARAMAGQQLVTAGLRLAASIRTLRAAEGG